MIATQLEGLSICADIVLAPRLKLTLERGATVDDINPALP